MNIERIVCVALGQNAGWQSKPQQQPSNLTGPNNSEDYNNLIRNSIKYYKRDQEKADNFVYNKALLNIKFLNVQNISQQKTIQIEDNIIRNLTNTLFCAVETHNNIH